MTYNAFGSRISEEGAPASGSLTLSDAYDAGLDPAPVTPTGKDAAPYQLLSGTIKATYNAHRSLSDEDESIIVAPGMMSGNTGILSCSCLLCAALLTEHCCTDTRFYWKLSQHIFRYNHHNGGDTNSLGGIHTVNECQFSCNRHFCYNANMDFQPRRSMGSWRSSVSLPHSSSTLMSPHPCRVWMVSSRLHYSHISSTISCVVGTQ